MFPKPILSEHNGESDAVRIATLVMAGCSPLSQGRLIRKKKGGNGGVRFANRRFMGLTVRAKEENCLSKMSTGVPLVVH